MSVAERVSFSNFCQLCTNVSEAHHDKKVSLLQSYIEGWKRKGKELERDEPNVDCSFYPVLRLLLPQLDRERGAFGVKERTLARLYIRILSLPKEGSDAAKILEYRTPKAVGSGCADFAEVAYWILKKRCSEGGQLSIEDVNKHLDNIAAKHAANDPRGVDSELIALLRGTSAEEQKWLIRVLLKEVRLGVGQSGILKSYHPDAKDFYDSNNNLEKVCSLLKDAGVRLHEVQIELFSPFRPMLAEECNIEKLAVCLKTSSYFYVETKLDGERFQLHKSGGSYKYFSRNGYDYSANFGRSRLEGSLTPRIADQFGADVESCILDGEMMAWNPGTEAFTSKGQNVDVKNLKEGSEHKACFCVFDILLHNGRVLTNQPLSCRLEVLSEAVAPLRGAICFVRRSRISSREEAVELLNEAIDSREEGIVLKAFMCAYRPSVRKDGGWYKIKPEYVEGLSDTLDLLILGGYFGQGRQQGKISHFLVGVAVCVEEESALFYSAARVGSGYSQSELQELQGKLSPHWKQTKAGEQPRGIEWTKEKPDLWIPPSKSFVLEIKATEIISSSLFRTGFTLRFPRVERVRYDKSWKSCLTLEEFEEKRKMAAGKLFSHHAAPAGSEAPARRRKAPRKSAALGSQFKAIDACAVESVSSLLAGREFCVFSGFGEVTKEALERKIVQFGGSLTQNPGRRTFCVLAETESTVRIRNVVRSGLYDVLKSSWLHSHLLQHSASLPQPKPHHFLAMSSRTSSTFATSYDAFGDHYRTPLTPDALGHLLEATEQSCKGMALSVEEKLELDVELFSGPSPYGLFRLCVAYLDRFPAVEDPSSGLLPELEADELTFRFFGGRCGERITDETTHVILFSGDLSRLADFHRRNSERRRKFRIVTEQWLRTSISTKSLSSHFGFP